MKDNEFLNWIHERLEKVHNENPRVDYMIRLRGLSLDYVSKKENSELVMKLQTRIESLVAENAKLFEEAKRELAYKDKKIAYLEAECERVYHPIREFWNQEKDEEMKRTRTQLEEANQIIDDFIMENDHADFCSKTECTCMDRKYFNKEANMERAINYFAKWNN